MKQVYSVDLINSFFSKQDATELILGLMNYKIELHSNKMFSTQVKYGVEDEESKYRLERLTASLELLKAYLNETEDTHFKFTAEIKIEPRSKTNI
jgi:phage terminase large subunit GpA-like protein